MPVFQIANQSGKAIIHGDRKIIPISQAMRIQLPGNQAALVWNRPVSILVQTEDGLEQVLPVRDMTRLLQVIFFGLAFFSIILLFVSAQKKRSHGGDDGN